MEVDSAVPADWVSTTTIPAAATARKVTPERHRAFRDRLRRSARMLGYAPLRGGLLIAPTDRSAELQSLLRDPPLHALLLAARIGLAPGDARRLADRLWALDALARDYRARIQTMHDAIAAATAGDPPSGPQALRALAATMQPVYETIARDPLLARELLPDEWPASLLGTAINAALRILGPPAAAYVDTLRLR